MKVAINSAVGFNTPAFAKPSTLILSSGMILIILVITRFATGFAKAISLFLAMTAGYVISAVFGLVNFDAIAKASWIAIPTLLPYGGLEWPGVVPIVVMTVCFLCAAAETTGHTIAVSKMCGVDPSEARIRGAVANDGLSSGLSALLGGMPLTSYSQNIGAIALTGVGSRFVVAFGGACLVVMALVPKLGAVISLIPGPVLGGALVFMFGMIASVGMSIIGNSVTARRNAVLFATSVGIALAISAAPPGTFDVVPPVLRILVGDGIVMGILTAVILNIFLPDEERSARKTELSIRPPQLEQAHRTV
jgi:xanthine permease